ncbi:MAG: lytic transglycosylase [Candidatus Rokuibacteriota bacterium]|nr:MAG: lytic transglycosylase [Candidatus Rokubacteria bacterium]
MDTSLNSRVSRLVAIALAAAVTASATSVSAQTYRLSEADGTVHFTNAPTDPRYQRLAGFTSGTAAGWLKLPGGDPSWYMTEIRGAAERYGVPEQLVSAVIRVESAFNPRAVSSKGARGLMQLMPETASVLGVRNMFDPYENIDGGVRHLRGLIDRFGQNLPLALAAYNAGEKAVTAYQGIPPYPETRDYVTRILRLFDASGDGPSAASTVIYRTVAEDGTVVYTNIPPNGRR